MDAILNQIFVGISIVAGLQPRGARRGRDRRPRAAQALRQLLAI
jgi:hypothetical protein